MHASIHPSIDECVDVHSNALAGTCILYMPHAPHMYRRMRTCFGKTHCVCMQKHHRHHITQTGPVLSRSKWAPPADVPQQEHAECFIRCVHCSVEIVEHFLSLPQSLMSPAPAIESDHQSNPYSLYIFLPRPCVVSAADDPAETDIVKYVEILVYTEGSHMQAPRLC